MPHLLFSSLGVVAAFLVAKCHSWPSALMHPTTMIGEVNGAVGDNDRCRVSEIKASLAVSTKRGRNAVLFCAQAMQS